ncbi:hypothetical protein, partial [Enterobacter hormaechei]|uniref:hypothetical protein n=1 Tax=Enterobacter hormaechei TaxID=158836 RepID=UPI002E2C08F0
TIIGEKEAFNLNPNGEIEESFQRKKDLSGEEFLYSPEYKNLQMGDYVLGVQERGTDKVAVFRLLTDE